ncbi:electron transfer flavoprotein subunit alpha/FixB family protein [Candidatus Liberibacter sp.]|uniref:electron transfer flavoprotein subunit alpha/FixB family protein n=1 Tax=Candidatus Liberibacter sp. TaxID=34022 RepID=UPI0015F57133|nr:FAD-binding protein [Candidatus Liberibacter sp.]MBA5723633.1 electron transfer flavoprotein subunit alpha/FixB family protein [Candidatus Liberibacter sp.]
MPILVLADYHQESLSEQTARVVTAAKKIGDDIHLLIAGESIERIVQQASNIHGVTKIIVAQNTVFCHKFAEPLSDLILSIAEGYKTIMASANAIGKDILPRIAAMLDVMQVSEIIEILSPNIFKRPMYAGNIIQTVQTTDPYQVITVRASAFPPSPTGDVLAHIENISSEYLTRNVLTPYFIKEDATPSNQVDLSSAKIIISGGKALGSAENFQKLIIPLAKKLGAAVGATRDAVEAGFAPNDWQVGQTGKVVSPDLYIAAGISGAIQHIAGMKESRVIVSINQDENAPIFKISDYFIVGDVFEILPELDRYL